MTDPNGRIPDPQHPTPLPRTAADFVRAFNASPHAQANHSDIAAYRDEFVDKAEVVHAYQRSAAADRARHASTGSSYTISLPMQLRAVMVRRLQILRGEIGRQAFQTWQVYFLLLSCLVSVV